LSVSKAAVRSAGRFASQLPRCRFPRQQVQSLEARRSVPPIRSRSLVTAFRSPVTIAASQRPPFQGQRSRPATSRSSRPVSPARSALRLHARPPGLHPGHDRFVASSPLRFFPHGSASRYLRSPLPLGTFASLGIKAFNRSRCLPARLTIPPDCLSLPATVSISSIGDGSTFLARYDSAGVGCSTPFH
jgi:hypothetical protein